MFGSFRLRGLLPLGTLVLAMMLGGCVYPAYPGYGYIMAATTAAARITAVASALSRTMAAGAATAAGVTTVGKSLSAGLMGFARAQPILRPYAVCRFGRMG